MRAWIEKLSGYPDKDMFDAEGRKLERPDFDALMHNVALESVPASQRTRYGLVVKRADLRTFPAPLRGFNSADDRDIDRFQESALFPGTPVVIAHESRDGELVVRRESRCTRPGSRSGSSRKARRTRCSPIRASRRTWW